MERHVARRRGSILPELADTRERILPENFVLARRDRGANFVCVLVRQRRARIERPSAVIQAFVVRFQMRGLGQSASGTITVFEDSIRIEVMLPLLLAQLGSRLLPSLKKEATLLLEKKP